MGKKTCAKNIMHGIIKQGNILYLPVVFLVFFSIIFSSFSYAEKWEKLESSIDERKIMTKEINTVEKIKKTSDVQEEKIQMKEWVPPLERHPNVDPNYQWKKDCAKSEHLDQKDTDKDGIIDNCDINLYSHKVIESGILFTVNYKVLGGSIQDIIFSSTVDNEIVGLSIGSINGGALIIEKPKFFDFVKYDNLNRLNFVYLNKNIDGSYYNQDVRKKPSESGPPITYVPFSSDIQEIKFEIRSLISNVNPTNRDNFLTTSGNYKVEIDWIPEELDKNVDSLFKFNFRNVDGSIISEQNIHYEIGISNHEPHNLIHLENDYTRTGDAAIILPEYTFPNGILTEPTQYDLQVKILEIDDVFVNDCVQVLLTVGGQSQLMNVPQTEECSELNQNNSQSNNSELNENDSQEIRPDTPTEIVIPEWIKDTAGWWISGQTSDIEFADLIENLIENKIIVVSFMESEQSSNKITIPYWIKDTTRWWYNESISDEEFAKSIEYLIKIGVVSV